MRTRNSTLFNISTFLVKIYEILSKAEMEDIIKWTEDGLAFMIIDQTKFSNEVLPIYFKHSNFSSFIRQLNMYDFHKSKRKGCPHQMFQHPQFKRDRYDELHLIKRKSNSSHPLRIQQTLHAKLINQEFPKNLMELNRNLLQMPMANGAMQMSNEAEVQQRQGGLMEQTSQLPENLGLDMTTLRQLNQ